MIQNTESQVRKRSLISRWGLIYLGKEHKGISIYQAADSFMGEGDGTPLQCSCLENPIDGGAWWAAVHGVTKSQTRLSNFTFAFHFHALEKEMATHSSVLAWRIPGMGQPGGLPSMGSHRVRHDWSDLAAAAAAADSFRRAPWSSPCRMSSFTRWQLNCWTDLIDDELVEYMLPFWNGLYRHEVDKVSRCVTAFLPRGKRL